VTPAGVDIVEFMISLNPGEDVKPLVKIASGGEISRIMLAIKNILSEADMIPVMVFDEIDTGISGKIAQNVGNKLFEISRKKQVICITHLAQIAGFSDTHYSVGKQVVDNKTETTIKKLGSTEKVQEIAKLLSGETVTAASIKAAEELIQAAGK
jgi:DNA repair protein RecN (Recombination protein N)